MIKLSLILLTIYIIYYVGIIVFDLFLKKEKVIITEISEEFSLADIEKEEAVSVGIEDVESMKTPKTFETKAEFFETNSDTEADIEDLRKKFEAEEDLEKNSLISDSIKEEKEIVPEQEEIAEREKQQNNTDWKSLMKLSETSVQMVANYEGQKVYHSIL